MLLVLAAGIAVAVAVPVTRANTCVSCALIDGSTTSGGNTCISTDIRTFCWDANGQSLPSCSVAPAGGCSPNGTPPCIGVGGVPAGYQCI